LVVLTVGGVSTTLTSSMVLCTSMISETSAGEVTPTRMSFCTTCFSLGATAADLEDARLQARHAEGPLGVGVGDADAADLGGRAGADLHAGTGIPFWS
jgi:hypothetical protein